MAEILFFILLVACLVVPFAIFHLWWWFGTMVVIVIVVICAEALVVWKTGKTLSQKFWKWSKENKWKAWLVIGLLTFAWLGLMAHLAWEIL